MKQIKQEIMDSFDEKMQEFSFNAKTINADVENNSVTVDGLDFTPLKQFLSQAVDKAVKKAFEEVLRFLDKLEIEQPEEYKTDESWRNWKHIRNSIVDKFLQDIEEKKKLVKGIKN